MSTQLPLASRSRSRCDAGDVAVVSLVPNALSPQPTLRPLPCELWTAIAQHLDDGRPGRHTTRALAHAHPMLNEAARRGQPVHYQAIQSAAAMALLAAPPQPPQPRAHILFARMSALRLTGAVPRSMERGRSPEWQPADWAALRALWSELRSLDLAAWSAGPDIVERLLGGEGAFAHIQVLKLNVAQWENGGGDLQTALLAQLPRLTSLTLTAPGSPAGRRRNPAPSELAAPELRLDLRPFVQLQALHLDGLARDMRGLRLPQDGALETLTLGHNEEGVAWVQAGGIVGCSLKTLTLDGSLQAAETANLSVQLGSSKTLQTLTLSPRHRALRALDLRAYAAMHTLCLNENAVNFFAWSAPNPCALVRLSLRATGLGRHNAPPASFWKLPNLQTLALGQNHLHGFFEALDAQSLPNLRELDLSHCGLKPEDVAACSLLDAPHLTTLDVRNNPFGSPGIDLLFAQDMPSLRSITLSFKAKRANSQARTLASQASVRKNWPSAENISVSLHAVTDGALQTRLAHFYEVNHLTNDRRDLVEPACTDKL